MTDNFVNLHNHSDYSILDGFGTINEYVNRAIELGQPALGLTDHGNICGLHSFIELCNSKGIVPIPGMEAYVSPVNPDGARCHRPIRYGQPGQESIDVSGNGAYVHMTLFAMNDTGMHSLYKLVREASIEGNAFNHLGLKEGEGNYYNKPRIDFDMLAKYNDGLIATSGCPSGEIQTRFRLGQDEQAYDYARRMKELFGERYFIEIMDHNMQGNDIERIVIPKLIQLSEDLNIPLLATNDSHYCMKEDAKHHEEMLCSNSKAKMTDETSDNGGSRFAFNGNEYYLKSYDDMMSIPVFQEHPEAVQNTLKLADMIEHIEFNLRSDLRPEVPIPAGYTDETWLKEKIKEGYNEKRVKEGADEKTLLESKKRIAHELPVFVNNNFMQYMLVVQDYINWARRNGIGVGFGRGSVGGSEIAYLMNISDTDPIRHDLMFERFLNPERISPPDVDTDFAASRRDEVVDYVKEKYGESHIANIITFNKFLSKTAIADMARIYGISVGDTEKAKKLIPELKPNTPAPLSMLYDENSSVYQAGSEFRELMEKPQWQPVITAARAIEGRIKTTGIHACGLIMSSHPITDAAPFIYKHNPDKPWGSSCCQWTYPELEAIGLIKMDFLSLSDLDIVSDTLANIRHTHNGKAPDMSELVHGPMNDKATYDMLSRGETSNIFQTSSTGMQALFKRMHPSKFEDIAASVALYRPGPMGMDAHTEYADRAAGKKPAYVVNEELDKAFHNTDVDKILAPTEGLLCYQEQCMNISRLMSGFSWGDADKLRKGMGHKQIDVLNAMEPKFIEGAIKHGYPEKETQKLWNYILDFGKYGFNKCLNGRTVICIVSDDVEYMKARIEDIYREHENGTPLNISILSMYPDGSIRPHKVKSITKQPDKMPTYEIRTASGKCIHATSNHRLLTTNGYGCIDDGMLTVGAELITDENWSKRLRSETVQTRRNNALIASRSKNGRESSRQHMRAYQSTLTYDNRSRHQKNIQKMHPNRTDNAVKAMHDRIQWLRENDEDWNKAFNENVFNNLMLSDNDCIYARKTPLSDGRMCDSMIEAEAGEYLIARGVDFELHKPILSGVSKNPKYCDFYANGLYFEMDGLHRGRQYFIDNKYGSDIPFVYMTPLDYKDVIDEALMSYHVENGDMIVSIMPTKTLPSGKAMSETVYDIEMEDDGPSNFIADGIVSHNSHACSYGIITYETAYLKCHYPAEFMAAILTDKIRKAKDVDDVKNAIREVRNIGLKVGALDVDSSDVGVSAVKKQHPDDPDIVFGISGIKGISPTTAKKFVDWREKHHPEPYENLDDFMRSLPPELIVKKLIDGLAGAGAFDKFGLSRRAVVTVVPELLEFYKNEARQNEAGKVSLFDDFEEDDDTDDDNNSFIIPPIPDWDWITRLEQEEKRLGVAVSGHPMSHIGDGLKFLQRGYASLEDDVYGTVITVDDAIARNIPSHESMNGRTYYDSIPVRIIADISDIEEKRTKTGKPVIRGRIESESATMPFTISKDSADKVYYDYKNGYGIRENHVYIITGKLSIDWNGNHSITADAFDELVLDSEGRTPIWIHLYKRNVENKKSPGFTKLMRILHNKKYAGDTPVYIHLYDENSKMYDSMDTGVTVSCSDEFMLALEKLLGSKRLGRWPITSE